ncbi:hypothetical protein GCM10007856_49230 [Azospirillum oryzae]|nr:hypothetical protein GCM10007856_49230 [Azospirillum oryzae]
MRGVGAKAAGESAVGGSAIGESAIGESVRRLVMVVLKAGTVAMAQNDRQNGSFERSGMSIP